MKNKRKLGTRFEEKAIKYLEASGYRILEKNYYTRCGEIDIVALDNNVLAFVEVKYRKTANCGTASEAVTYSKKQRIIHSARYYLYKHPGFSKNEMRFDVFAIDNEDYLIIKNAFEAY